MSAIASQWFAFRKWVPFTFQLKAWKAFAEEKNGLVHASTGTGKTYSVWLPALEAIMQQGPGKGIRVIWITPLRALATDIEASLRLPVEEMDLPVQIASRTGDTSSAQKKKLKEQWPDVLITTPETLSLLLADVRAHEHFANLLGIVVDEWHELLAGKRGVQTELCLARVRKYAKQVRTWGLSATIGNVAEALAVLCGGDTRQAVVVKGDVPKQMVLDTLIPAEMERYPWAGHLGIRLLNQVVSEVEKCNSCIIFTNTRSQSEIWYQSVLEARPEWAGLIAVHHGSLDKELRGFVEQGVKGGSLRLVVATSSLDLGVDFSPVERVIQIGSPKGVARILQRAGRSGHGPGQTSRITFVPTNAFELVEFAAVKQAISTGHVESRSPLDSPLDLLVQHLITIGIGGGFAPDEMFEEVRSCYSYRLLTRAQWEWVLDFAVTGGKALHAYPEYARLHLHKGRYYITSHKLARQHLMNIGTIVSDASVRIRFQNGKSLGTIEEYFISRLRIGECFVFAGRVLELVMMKNNEAWVKNASSSKASVPSWSGGRMPLSTELSKAVRVKLEDALMHRYEGEEMTAVKPILEIQLRDSQLPRQDELLIEVFTSKDGHHLVFYPFEGRLVHEGLMALFAFRISRIVPISFSLACNDYGFELLSDQPPPLMDALEEGLFESRSLDTHIVHSMNASELSRRQFREIARVAGLIFQGYPGQKTGGRNIQANTGLLFDVFTRFDPDNLLLHQARKEVMERQLEISRIRQTLDRMSRAKLIIKELQHPSPLSFPLMVDRLRDKLSSEQLLERIRKMQLDI